MVCEPSLSVPSLHQSKTQLQILYASKAYAQSQCLHFVGHTCALVDRAAYVLY